MEKLDNKNIIVYGLGISGLSAIKALSRYNCNITLIDGKNKEELKEELEELREYKFKKVLSGDSIDLKGYDLLVKSPGIKESNPLIKQAIDMGIKVITDLELGYILTKTDKIVAITGTNGKTTTTSMIGKIIESKYKDTRLVGNIGIGLVDEMDKSNEESVFVVEASSFQLNNIHDFRPYISVITNLSQDHIDWHGSYNDYIEAKLKIFKNQAGRGHIILNYDDPILRSLGQKLDNVFFFSSREILTKGVYIEDGQIIILDNKKTKLMNISETEHIIDNVLAAVAAAYKFGIGFKNIRQELINMKPLEHRIEKFLEFDNIVFYNDSKGTNPESTIKALDLIEAPIILIAGGYDKGADFTELSHHYSKLKLLILMGETKDKLKNKAIEAGFKQIIEVDNMEEAVDQAFENMESGDRVLLSPACASWGVYNNFEERGRHFKDLVVKKVDKYEKKN